MRTAPALLTVVLALFALVPRVTADESAPPAYRVIVHPQNSTSHLARTFLQDAFLKKVTRWPGDVAISPVDQNKTSATRRAFSEQVIKRSVAAVRIYWQQRIFSGRDVPPPEVDADGEVVAYVLKHEGAVGYVSGTADVGKAKVVGVSK